MTKETHLNGYAKPIAALTMLSLLAGAVAFFSDIHADFVTRDELKIVILEHQNARLIEAEEQEN